MNHGGIDSSSKLLTDPRLKEYYEQLKKSYQCKDCKENPLEIYLAWLNHSPMFLCKECMLEATERAQRENLSFGVQMKLHVGKSVEHQIIKRKVLLDMVDRENGI